ncbi:MAG TPA: sigma-70 family RNA polymerase sigma factor [Gemmatimonadota bacterium]|nr:sigma-70 family RNA polymerase sigma factor [Gemmatimonadota bacterium]
MDDRDLVRRAQAGDGEAYGRLVELHQPRIYATLAKLTHDRELALDLTQEAFIRAWEELDGFQRRAAFSTWLYRIAVRLAYDALRRERLRGESGSTDRLADPAPRPDDRAAAGDETARLRQRIERLPEMQRAVVTLRTWNDLSYREIAEILGTSEGSARVSFHHAIARLRAWYESEANTR